MKPAIYVMALTLFVACSKSNPNIRKPKIPLNECRSVFNDFTLCYDSLVTDSRCPLPGNCFWAGIGVARFSFHTATDEHTLTLATYDLVHYRKDTTIDGNHFELVELAPYPGSKPAPQTATVKVTRQ